MSDEDHSEVEEENNQDQLLQEHSITDCEEEHNNIDEFSNTSSSQGDEEGNSDTEYEDDMNDDLLEEHDQHRRQTNSRLNDHSDFGETRLVAKYQQQLSNSDTKKRRKEMLYPGKLFEIIPSCQVKSTSNFNTQPQLVTVKQNDTTDIVEGMFDNVSRIINDKSKTQEQSKFNIQIAEDSQDSALKFYNEISSMQAIQVNEVSEMTSSAGKTSIDIEHLFKMKEEYVFVFGN